jgi:hypothetical protein
MPTDACRKIVFWWDGEYEGECELPDKHDGPHYDGLSWFDDNGNEVDEPADPLVHCQRCPEAMPPSRLLEHVRLLHPDVDVEPVEDQVQEESGS